LQFLNFTGMQLQVVNVRIASRLSDSASYPPNLDQRIVWYEQSLVEDLLQRQQRTDPGRVQGIITELDRLLSVGSTSARVGTAHLRMYSEVLRAVARDLGRSIQFAGQNDRVRIGCGLTDYLRQQVPAKELARLCQRRSRSWIRRLCGGAPLIAGTPLVSASTALRSP
ncbi:MAG: hypothetical protein JOY91_12505, partial [Sinobacteraceae bacterium]|nr:hypothetical protein [Nevskiaceae bacterium]